MLLLEISELQLFQKKSSVCVPLLCCCARGLSRMGTTPSLPRGTQSGGVPELRTQRTVGHGVQTLKDGVFCGHRVWELP